jgi:hypothetical protein
MKIVTFNAGKVKEIRLLKNLHQFFIVQYYVQESTGQYQKTYVCFPCYAYDSGIVELLAQPPNHPIYEALKNLPTVLPLPSHKLSLSIESKQRTENNPFDFKVNIKILERSRMPIELQAFELNELDAYNSVLTWRRALGDVIIT